MRKNFHYWFSYTGSYKAENFGTVLYLYSPTTFKVMMLNNGNINRTEGMRARSLPNFTGTNGPSAPLAGRPGQGARKADPSSAARADKYPIPSLFEYRSKPRDYNVL